ncbi:MAG TPA: MFS transporter [Roseomonas sp.]|nr:MFS transporter [Roseomonas sp.]
MTSKRSARGLDWLTFFAADVQTGFGPFIAVYLAMHDWSDAQVGLALSIGSLTMLLSQVPAGALVDVLPRKRLAALAALLAIAGSAVLLALWPDPVPVYAAELLHGFASCVLVPALAAISLALVGRKALSDRLGRNGRFSALGNAAAAGMLGLAGAYVSIASVFWLTAALTVPAMLALYSIRAEDLRDRVSAMRKRGSGEHGLRRLLLNKAVLVFAACVALFTLANAAMLPLASTAITRTSGAMSNLPVAGGIVVSQCVVAGLSPWMARLSDQRGRRFVLLLGILALPLRGLWLALITSPSALLLAQMLDGISAAMLAVLVPLVAADLTRGTNRFNLCMGIFGLAVGIGATVSTTAAGAIASHFGTPLALGGLAVVGLLCFLLALFAMPETKPQKAARELAIA